MIRVGVDLGNSLCRIARLDARGMPVLVADAEDSGQLGTRPTIVLERDSALVGRLAEERLADEPTLAAIEGVEPALSSEGSVHQDAFGRSWSAAGITALLLRKLARDCAAGLNESIEALAVAVPASFGERERTALGDAAHLAGLPEPMLIDSAVAVALHDAVQDPAESVLVCEVGAERIAVTLVRARPEGLHEVVVARSCNEGGANAVARVLADCIARSIAEAAGVDALSDPVCARELLRMAKEARSELAAGRELVEGSLVVRGRVLDFALTLSQLAEALATPLAAFSRCVRECLVEARSEAAALPRVILTGSGASGMYMDCLSDKFGVRRERLLLDAEGCRAVFGAALAAGRQTTADPSRRATRDGHVAADLGLRVFDAERGRAGLRVVVPRGTALPCTRSATVFTTRADQDQLVLDVVERAGGSEELQPLSSVRLGPLGRPGKNHPIELGFVCGLDGSLRIEARDPRSGQSVDHVVENATGGPLAAEHAQVQRLRINE